MSSRSLVALPLLALSACATEPCSPGVTRKAIHATTVAAVLDTEIDPDRNLVYCAALELAWKRLRAMLGGPVQLEGGGAVADKLNASTTTDTQLDAGSVFAAAGRAGEDFDGACRRALHAKFGADFPEPPSPEIQSPDDILVHAALFKVLRFDPELEELPSRVRFRGADGRYASVDAFGIEAFRPGDPGHERISRQIDVSYQDEEHLLVRFVPSDSVDELVLARVPPRPTLLATVEAADALSKRERTWRLTENAHLAIPRIDFAIFHRFGELVGKDLLNGSRDSAGHPHRIRDVTQETRFQLDERGAVLRSVAELHVEYRSAPPVGARLVFDRPFLLFLRKRGEARPYVAVWINNAELFGSP